MTKIPKRSRSATVINADPDTGKTLEQWVKIAQRNKLSKHCEIVKLLKSDHLRGDQS